LAVPLITERLEKLSDAQEFSYLWQEPVYEKELLKWKDAQEHITRESLERALGVLENWDFKDEGTLRFRLDSVAVADEGKNRGIVYWPLRVALSGKEKSPDPVQLTVVLGKNETIKRVKEAIKKVGLSN
jgi:glutamyl/glutaminyl-tRNA synthetase